jgi:hypothetical protein
MTDTKNFILELLSDYDFLKYKIVKSDSKGVWISVKDKLGYNYRLYYSNDSNREQIRNKILNIVENYERRNNKNYGRN